MRTRTRRISRGLAVLVALLLSTTPAHAAPGGTALDWQDCPNPADIPLHGLRCAKVRVPLDYRDPAGRTIDLTISRLASAKPEKRRGILLMNNGGPGIPSLLMPARGIPLGLPQSVRDSYDLIGFDPRGVGESTPVGCDIPREYGSSVQPYPRNAGDVVRHAALVRRVAENCGKNDSGKLLPFISTANTARDMDRIRAALNERKASYLGVSYGTYLGAVYAALFPARTDRVLLDSAVGSGGMDETQFRRIGAGFQERFPDFARWAAARAQTYHLGDTPEQVTAKYFELAERLGPDFRGGTLDALTGRMSSDDQFPELARRWQAADREHQPRIAPTDNVLSAQTHVICNDADWPASVGHYVRAVERDRVRFPMFGAAAANISPCAFWPVDPIEPPVRIGGRGPSNVLIVQNLRDPITPLAGARSLRAAFGGRARLVTVDQGGHGVYLLVGQNRCGKDSVTNFLVHGTRADASCPAEPPA
ncbi:alpha/beta hydrolase [Amycolatopsis anabasis]|uniref:alpha/beta hydrolase n=1 Tax=Amycolatopsis anabasis TaxID=1840409 RepID=UPI00131BD9F1|nr:alpha/beta hydrolase [Amycolatopsis anabasis]